MDQNIFVHIASNYCIDDLSPNAMLLYTSHVRTKFSIYVLQVSQALIILNGYVVLVIQTLKLVNVQAV